jgi:hypothetical protein
MQVRYAFAVRLVRLGAKTTSQDSNCRFHAVDLKLRIDSPWQPCAIDLKSFVSCFEWDEFLDKWGAATKLSVADVIGLVRIFTAMRTIA